MIQTAPVVVDSAHRRVHRAFILAGNVPLQDPEHRDRRGVPSRAAPKE